MDTNDIVLAIDGEISRLQQAKALLTDIQAHPCKAQTRPTGRCIWERQGNQLQTGGI
jgi:hypothetical protein